MDVRDAQEGRMYLYADQPFSGSVLEQ